MTNIQKIITDPLRYPIAGSIDKVWDSFFQGDSYQRGAQGLSFEIKPEEDAVIAEVEVPGVDPADVKVRVEGRAILVESPRGNAYFTIGSRVDIDNVAASIKHGLLRLRVPKREARKVDVTVDVEE